MHTKCPNCQALFRVHVKQFQQAQGKVRCGQCGSLFDAQRNIVSPKAGDILSDLERPTGPGTQTRVKRSGTSGHIPHKPPFQEQDDIPIPKLIPESSEGAHRPLPPATQTITLAIEGKKHETNLDSKTRNYPPLSTVSLGLGCIALVFLLLAQFFYFHSDRVHNQPFLAGITKAVCDTVGCEIQPTRDINRIEIINRNVFSHPTVTNALMITATFANVAPFPQPYPVLQVSLTDLQGSIVAARRFLPQEYLSNPDESATLMKPGVPIDVNVEVQDPQNGALAFEFAFFDTSRMGHP